MHCVSAFSCQATFASGKGAGRYVRYPDDLKCHFPLARMAGQHYPGAPSCKECNKRVPLSTPWRARSVLSRELSVQFPGVLANRLRRNNGNVRFLAERHKLVEGILLFCGLR